MTDTSRSVYLGLGRAFVAIGGAVALASLLDRVGGWGYFTSSPVGTAAFLVVIGSLLLWTVRQADRQADPAPRDALPPEPAAPSTEGDEPRS